MSYIKLIESAKEEKRVCGSAINQVECARLSVAYWKNRAEVAEKNADRLATGYNIMRLIETIDADKLIKIMAEHEKSLEARK
jgi:hypothetical protein